MHPPPGIYRRPRSRQIEITLFQIMFSNNTHSTDLIGPDYYTNDSCSSVVEYRGSIAEEYYNTRGSVVEYRGSVAGYYNRGSVVVEYRGRSVAEYHNIRGNVVEYRGNIAECYKRACMIKCGGSTGTRHCRRLA